MYSYEIIEIISSVRKRSMVFPNFIMRGLFPEDIKFKYVLDILSSYLNEVKKKSKNIFKKKSTNSAIIPNCFPNLQIEDSKIAISFGLHFSNIYQKINLILR